MKVKLMSNESTAGKTLDFIFDINEGIKELNQNMMQLQVRLDNIIVLLKKK